MPRRALQFASFFLIPLTALSASDKPAQKPLQPQSRVWILRALTAEFAILKKALPRGQEGLLVNAEGKVDERALEIQLANHGPAASIILLSILFGAVHRANPGASAAGLLNTVIVGVLLALAYLRTRRLWLPIGIHWGWNLAEASWGFPVSGIKIEGMPLVAVSSGHPLITGGAYGPEASLVGTLVIVAGIAGLLWSGVEQNHAA